MDVSRALLLPDVQRPTDGLLKTLSIYWDELVIPDYVERAVGPGRTEFIEPSSTFAAMEDVGILVRQERELDLPAMDPSELPESLQVELDGVEDAHRAEEMNRLMKWLVLPLLREIPEDVRGDQDRLQNYLAEHPGAAQIAVKNMNESISEYAAQHYLGRMQDAFEISSQHHLAPLAQSPISHVASIVGASADAPRSEAALLSAAIQAFELDPETPVERILQFREKNKASLGRFRASLVDLSEGLRGDADPTQLLATARDIYCNRVVPALGDLEDVLKEGQIRFFFKSLVGATAIAMAPVDPTRAVEGSATLIGQTLNYSFSRKKLIREHPFGFLHQVSSELSPLQAKPSVETLSITMASPVEQVKKMIATDQLGMEAMQRFFFSKGFDEQEKLDA